MCIATSNYHTWDDSDVILSTKVTDRHVVGILRCSSVTSTYVFLLVLNYTLAPRLVRCSHFNLKYVDINYTSNMAAWFYALVSEITSPLA